MAGEHDAEKDNRPYTWQLNMAGEIVYPYHAIPTVFDIQPDPTSSNTHQQLLDNNSLASFHAIGIGVPNSPLNLIATAGYDGDIISVTFLASSSSSCCCYNSCCAIHAVPIIANHTLTTADVASLHNNQRLFIDRTTSP